ncbi:MAG: hypothetical protein J6Q15_03575, partial [Clostridia bacterium]|nr:hypothetical protein [Clostridia bacterium]
MFEQVAIDIEFKYYAVSPSVEEDTNAGQGYTYSYENFDKTTIIKEGSTIKLNRGVDNLGYRFDGYSYVAPKGVELSKEFDLTDISSTQQQFVM